MRRILPLSFLSLLAFPLLNQGQSPAVYALAGATYTQSFDGLPASGSFSPAGKGPLALTAAPINAANLAGWQYWMTSGSNTNAVFAVGTGSSTGNGTYSLGSSAAADRSLGSLAASSGVYSFGFIVTNNTGLPLNSCTISFTAEQWRRGGSGNRNAWTFRYKTGTFTGIDQNDCSVEHALDFGSIQTATGASALNGNLPENQQLVSFILRGIRWNPGEQLLLRWDDADESGSDDVCAIDNFSFTASQLTLPPSPITLPATAVGKQTATLNGTVNDNFGKTSVWFELDTANDFIHAQILRPVADTLAAGTGITSLSAQAVDLRIGIKYYFRMMAVNQAGAVSGSTSTFTTNFSVPELHTAAPSGINPTSLTAGGIITSDGGTPVIEQGILWATTDTPALSDHKITMTVASGAFSGSVNALPAATSVTLRAYATNVAGTGYGETVQAIIPTTVLSITPTVSGPVNSAAVSFLCRTAHPVTGLSPANFTAQRAGMSEASVMSVTGSGTNYTIIVNPGSADCQLSLALANANGCSAPVYNLPFSSPPIAIDKTAPQINAVLIPDTFAKIGDTIMVSISVKADTSVYKMSSATLNGLPLQQFTKQNDSLYSAFAVVPNAGADFAADADIPVSFTLSDPAGNASAFNIPIMQPHDRIDANKPVLTSINLPSDKLYKAGDTLNFILHFNERVTVTNLGTASGFSVMIGSRTKFTTYVSGSGSDSILTQYIIPVGDSDKDGIHLNSPIVWLNGAIRDMAGNSALLSISIPDSKNIRVDGIAPVISTVSVPAAGVYNSGNLLDFLVNFSEKMFVTGKPSLPLIIGNTTKQAGYMSGSGSTSLLFRYSIVQDDQDTDGIKTGAAINLAESSITDEAGNNAINAVTGVGTLSNLLVNPPTVSMLGVAVPSEKIYTAGDTLFFTASFNEAVYVQAEKGRPAIRLTIGSSSKQAAFLDGSGSRTLVFAYAIQPGDSDTNGIQLGATLALNGGTIADIRGNNIPLALQSPGNTGSILVDAVPPVVKEVIVPAKATYHEGDTLWFKVSCSERIMVNLNGAIDTPFMQLKIGSQSKRLQYSHGTGSNALLFRYVIALHDLDKNGIGIDSVITTANTQLTDLAGNALNLLLKNVGPVSFIKVDGEGLELNTGADSITVCENAPAASIAELLQVKDAEDNEEIFWSVVSPPAHGLLSKTDFSTRSNGRSISPSSLTYQPDQLFSGTDLATFKISDGIHDIIRMIRFRVLAGISNNNISGATTACSSVNADLIAGSSPSGGDGTYKSMWEIAAADSNVYTRVASATDLLQFRPGKLNADTWIRRRVESAGCASTSNVLKITVLKNGFWTGAYDSIWNNTNNWCNNMVPNRQTNVIIDGAASYQPVITDTAACNNLLLRNNAHIKLKGEISVGGNLQGTSDAIDASKGCLVMTGNQRQMIRDIFKARTLSQLVIDNDSAVAIEAELNINDTLTLRKGKLVTNNLLRLRATASIAPAAPGTNVIGEMRIEHVMQSGKKTFQLFSHPLAKNIPLDMLKTGITITGSGGAANGFDQSADNTSSAFYFSPATTSDSTGIIQAWKPFANTAGQSPDVWFDGRGIRLLVLPLAAKQTGIDTLNQNIEKIELSGPIHLGDVAMNLSVANSIRYHAIGNPYAAAIDLSTVARGSSVGNSYWTWNADAGLHGAYIAVPFNVPNMLPAFGVVIVKTTDSADAFMMFTENCKTVNGGSTTASFLPANNHFLELWLEKDNHWFDKWLLLFSDTARRYVDEQDAEKLMNEDANLYSISSEKVKLAIDARPHSNQGSIPLGLKTTVAGNYSLRIGKLSLPGGNELQLHDRLLDRWMKLMPDSSYAFEVNSDTLTSGDKRFELAAPPAITGDSTVYFKVFVQTYPQPAKQNAMIKFIAPRAGNTVLRIYGPTGLALFEKQLGFQQSGAVQVELAHYPPGIYLAEIRCGEHAGLQKIIIQ